MKKFLHISLLVMAVSIFLGASVYSGGHLADRIVNIDKAHFETHVGDHYQTSIQNTLGSGAFVNTIINSTTALPHLLLCLDAQGETLIEFYRSPTCSVLGTPQTVTNMNDASGNTAVTEIYLNPTCSAEGTSLPGWTQKLGSGQQTGGSTRTTNEHVLRKATLYIVRITSSAASNDINHIYDAYEEED